VRVLSWHLLPVVRLLSRNSYLMVFKLMTHYRENRSPSGGEDSLPHLAHLRHNPPAQG